MHRFRRDAVIGGDGVLDEFPRQQPRLSGLTVSRRRSPVKVSGLAREGEEALLQEPPR